MTGRHILMAVLLAGGAAGLGLAGGLSAQEAGGAGVARDMPMDMPMDGDMSSMMGGGFHGAMGFGAGFDFAAVDTDSDGKLTEAEIRAHRQAGMAGFDADGDGLISAAELSAQMMQRMQDRAGAMAAARIARSDIDGDGKLSAAELLSPPMAGRMLSRVDADGDGAITEDEIAAARAAMAEHRAEGRGKGYGGHGGQGRMGRQGDGQSGGGRFGGHHPWFGMTDGDDAQD